MAIISDSLLQKCDIFTTLSCGIVFHNFDKSLKSEMILSIFKLISVTIMIVLYFSYRENLEKNKKHT